MIHHLGDLVRRLRNERGWRVGDLATQLGCPPAQRRRNKICRWIVQLEETGTGQDRVFEERVLSLLGAASTQVAAIRQKMANDRRRHFDEWATASTAPCMWLHAAGVALRVPFPPDMKAVQDLELHARHLAQTKHIRITIEFSRRLLGFINEAGEFLNYQEVTPASWLYAATQLTGFSFSA